MLQEWKAQTKFGELLTLAVSFEIVILYWLGFCRI
jgi:hypothetical protein